MTKTHCDLCDEAVPDGAVRILPHPNDFGYSESCEKCYDLFVLTVEPHYKRQIDNLKRLDGILRKNIKKAFPKANPRILVPNK